MINKHKQKGAEIVEFAMIALLFFAMLFAVIEFSRALFVWNALTEATRRAARMAVVCPVGSPIPAQVAIFDVIGGTLGTSPIIANLTPAMVVVNYSDASANPAFVQVSIDVSAETGYKHTLLIPLWGGPLTFSPATIEFTTTLYSESLGAVPTYPPAPAAATNCKF